MPELRAAPPNHDNNNNEDEEIPPNAPQPSINQATREERDSTGTHARISRKDNLTTLHRLSKSHQVTQSHESSPREGKARHAQSRRPREPEIGIDIATRRGQGMLHGRVGDDGRAGGRRVEYNMVKHGKGRYWSTWYDVVLANKTKRHQKGW
ncbi:hypothetical protein BP6252_04594 [Coleophoma cylindrospora]|uniref:Uncharacterized protein n=1 Tax=Coleophoma cylindrospora TaxID=1849047 RepID=A0A3D8S113_9HELO|nr:hypothetical protein BP6252_04594 [Coleophoma cylindrospora]